MKRRAIPILIGVLLLAAVPLALATGVVHDADQLIGAERCGGCHADQLAAWRAGPHAKAYQVLDEHERNDTRCYGCHSTGLAPEHHGVQCESCHGAGRNFAKVLVMRDAELARVVGLQDPTAATCDRCHTEDAPNIRAFDPATKLERIRHWPAGYTPDITPPQPAKDDDGA